MLTPRSRKPVSIPSVPPVAHEGRMLGLFRARGRSTHRRLRERAAEAPAVRVGGAGRTDQPGSTFHGATARWVALG